MHIRLLVCLTCTTALLIAPPEDFTNSETPSLVQPKNNAEQYEQWRSIYQPNPAFDGRSEFEQALKTQDFTKAKELFENIKRSATTTETFAQHLRDRYNNMNGKITDIYSGKSMDEARQQFMLDINKVNPHLAKVLRDSFTTFKPVKLVARSDQKYFDWLDQYPERLLHPAELHELTPLEIAVQTGNTQMAEGIDKIAGKNNIEAIDLTDPLINEYKKIMTQQGAKEAYEYLEKVYALNIPRVSNLLHDQIKDIQFVDLSQNSESNNTFVKATQDATSKITTKQQKVSSGIKKK